MKLYSKTQHTLFHLSDDDKLKRCVQRDPRVQLVGPVSEDVPCHVLFA